MIIDPREGKDIVDSAAVKVGCAGWSIPPRYAHQFVRSRSHLQRYVQVLNCSEINSSFRREHKAATWQRWAASAPDDFRFSVKMPKTITHDAKLKCSVELLIEFFQQIRSRLHGSPRPYYSRYSDEFVKALARKAEELAGTARVWCVFDNTASGWAIENAIALRMELASSSCQVSEGPFFSINLHDPRNQHRLSFRLSLSVLPAFRGWLIDVELMAGPR
jgi:uncharacterized protein YecE (DUF72 family)